jgi:hypothetical protein
MCRVGLGPAWFRIDGARPIAQNAKNGINTTNKCEKYADDISSTDARKTIVPSWETKHQGGWQR